jgi:hypothetical protein
MDDASTVTPTNLAVAINQDCTLCTTVAEAYQFVLTTNGPVHFTAEGNKELADIKRAFLELGKENLTPEELQTRIDALVDRLRNVLENELVQAGADENGQSPPSDQSQTGPTSTQPANPPAPDVTPTTTTTETDTTTTETTPTTTDTTPATTTTTTTTETTPTTTDTTTTTTTTTTTGQ